MCFKQLHIQPGDGYIVGNERAASWLRGPAIVIRRPYMDAAARLAMWMDFDVRLFDGFCVCVLGEHDFIVPPVRASGHSLQKECLHEWILSLGAELINPHTKVRKSSSDQRTDYKLCTSNK
jgi:hypothetical protein